MYSIYTPYIMLNFMFYIFIIHACLYACVYVLILPYATKLHVGTYCLSKWKPVLIRNKLCYLQMSEYAFLFAYSQINVIWFFNSLG